MKNPIKISLAIIFLSGANCFEMIGNLNASEEDDPGWNPGGCTVRSRDPSSGDEVRPEEKAFPSYDKTECENESGCRVDIYKWKGYRVYYVADGTCPTFEDIGDWTYYVDSNCGGPCSPPPGGKGDDEPGRGGGGGGDDDCDNDGIPNHRDPTPGCDDDDDGPDPQPCVRTYSTNNEDIVNDCDPVWTVPEVSELPDAILNENGLNLVYDEVSIYRWRWGYYPYPTDSDSSEPVDPENIVTYMKESYTRTQSGCFQDSGENPTSVEGSWSYAYDNVGSQICYNRSGFLNYVTRGGTPREPEITPVQKIFAVDYKDEGSVFASIINTYTLSEPMTTAEFRSICGTLMPGHRSNFPYRTAGDFSTRVVATQSDNYSGPGYHHHYSARQKRFKFKWGDQVEEEDKYPVEYHAFYRPFDNPDTEDVDESAQLEYLEPVTWDGLGTESPVFNQFSVSSALGDKPGSVVLLKVDVESDKAASGSYFPEDNRIDPIILRNPQSFGEIANDDIDPCDRQRDDPALVVFYEDVVDASYNVEDFDVELNVGTDGLVDVFQWSKVKGPDSGTLTDANKSNALYANPKVGGLYQFDVDLGNQSIRTSLLLPLAGADITDWLEAEAASIGPWARAHLRATEEANYSNKPFVTRYAVFRTWITISGAFFDYTLDSVDANELSPCRRYQSDISDEAEYGYLTVSGVVVHGSKINLALWSLFGNHWGYSQYELAAGGHLNQIMTRFSLDPVSSTEAIGLGSQMFLFPNTSMDSPERINHLRRMQSDHDLIEEKLWPSPYPMDSSKSDMSRPNPELPTTPNPGSDQPPF